MLKARAGNLVILGLAEEHVRRIKNGDSIYTSLEVLGLDLRVMICYAETIEILKQAVQPFIGPDTKVSDTSAKPPEG